MKGILLILLTVLLFRIELVLGSTIEKDGIRLRGKIENAAGKAIDGEIKVYVQDGFHSMRGPQTILPQLCHIKEGEFELLLPIENEIAYLNFSILEEGQVREVDYGINNFRYFLAEKSDDIYFLINQNDVTVSGEGAKKWQIQHEIYQFGGRDRTESIKAANARKYKKQFEEIRLSNDAFIEKGTSHLETYKGEIENDIYDLLYFDIIGYAYLKVLQPLKVGDVYKDDEFHWAKLFVDEYFVDKTFNSQHMESKLNSVYYSNYLFELLYARTFFSKNEPSKGRLPFGEVYETTIKSCESPLLDKILYINFLYWGGQPEVLSLVKDAQKRITSMDIQERLEKFKDIHSASGRVYSFSLRDTLGTVYTPESFKGKTVLLDFWYTGCMPCKYLAMLLDSFMKDYENREEVVFLNVNVNDSDSKWMFGLRSGDYSSPNQICVTTGGFDHPLLKHYQYDSFPRLLIFDKEGKIVTTNAPRPIDEESSSKLKALLDR